MRFNRRALLIIAASSALVGGAGTLAAQSVGSIRGRVVEGATLRPLAGAQVTVPGTGRGALTDAAGNYVVSGVPVTARQVEADMLGFATVSKPVTMQAGQAVVVDFSLAQQAISLNEIVVTGVPGAVSKRTLGNSITTVNAAEATAKTTISSFAELLQGRATGVTMMDNGGTVGTSGSMRIHGISSLSGNNQPVVYVDGVRVYTGAAGNYNNMYLRGSAYAPSTGIGSQDASTLSMINPEDIKSIEVIKGPAAATLYGADAANGVINIITKKGEPGQQKLQWNFRTYYGRTDWAQDAVRNYTACTLVRDTLTLLAADNTRAPAYPDCQGNVGSVLNYSGLSDNPNGLRAGLASEYSLSVRGGGDGYSFYIAGNRNLDQGVFLNNYMERTSGRANFAFYPSQKVDFSVNVGYDRTHSRFPTNDNGGEGLIISAANWSPGYNYQAAWGLTSQEYQDTRGFAWNSPAVSNEFDSQLWGTRLTLANTLNYRPFSWFANRLTGGIDVNDRTASQYYAPGAYSDIPQGAYYERRPKDNVYTIDYAGTISNNFRADLDSKLSFGMQYNKHDYAVTSGQGNGFATELNRMISQAAVTKGSDGAEQTALLGFFGQEQIGWRDRLYLTGAVRMDNSSVFGDEVNRIFYPKAMVSYIISDEPWFHVRYLDQLKLRGAWGEAGNAPGPFSAVRSYNTLVLTLPDANSVSGITLGSFGNYNLKPERGQEFEAGFEASLLHDRAGVDFTYYNKTMNDALMSVPVVPSSGFTGSQWQNLGKISNKGIELTLNGTPVQMRQVSWNSRMSIYTNHNELVSFGYERSPITIGYYGAPQRHQPGYPLAGFWAKQYLRNADGSYMRTAPGMGFPLGKLVLTDTATYVGPSTPTREISFSNTFTFFRDLDLYFLLDYRGGYYQYDYKDLSRCSGGRCKDVADAQATVDDANASAQAKQDAQQTLDLLTSSGGLGTYDRAVNFIQRADFIRLGDVSLTYRIPDRFTRQFSADALSLTVAAHNLGFLWKPYYRGDDPDVNFYGMNDFRRADAWTMPGLRRFALSLNVTF